LTFDQCPTPCGAAAEKVKAAGMRQEGFWLLMAVAEKKQLS